MAEHRLKTWPPYFKAQEEGRKPFEVRRDDRGYDVGDVLVLLEFDPRGEAFGVGIFTGKELRRRVTYVMRGGQHGVVPNYVVMGTVPEVAGG